MPHEISASQQTAGPLDVDCTPQSATLVNYIDVRSHGERVGKAYGQTPAFDLDEVRQLQTTFEAALIGTDADRGAKTHPAYSNILATVIVDARNVYASPKASRRR